VNERRYLGGRFLRFYGDGFRMQSRAGWFYVALKCNLYRFYLGLGRLTITVDEAGELR
jgi:hypothetical protein